MARLEPKSPSEAAEHLKKMACSLFAVRGVDGVTVREIADAAGQKNHGAVGYHFGSKEALVRALVVDGAVLIDDRRNAQLDRLEAAGGPFTIREVVDLLIYTSIDISGGGASEESYVRFFVMLNMTHRQLLYDALENRWNSGYKRILGHLRRLMPDMPLTVKNQRFLFMGGAIRAVLAMREGVLADTSRPHEMWTAASSLEHFAQLICAMLNAPDAQLTGPLPAVAPPLELADTLANSVKTAAPTAAS